MASDRGSSQSLSHSPARLIAKTDEAIKAFDKAIELKSDFEGVWCNKGLTLEESGKHEEAIQAYTKIIELNPSIWQAWVGKGLALKSLGRTAESDAAFAKAKELGYTG